jgi:hypothetical protein
MLDRDLALLYGVETRVLNQAVQRNIKRFPNDFMFALTREEIRNISQIVISSKIKQERIQDHDEQIIDIFKAIRQLMAPPVKPKRKITCFSLTTVPIRSQRKAGQIWEKERQ